MSYYEALLYEDEEVLRVIPVHPFGFLWAIVLGLLFICSAFFFIIPLFAWERIGFSVFGLLLVVGIYLGLRVITMVRYSSFIITDERLIDWDQRGIFDQEISEVSLEEITDVSYRMKGMVQSMAQVGSVRVVAQDGEVTLVLHGVQHPQEAQRFINTSRRDVQGE